MAVSLYQYQTDLGTTYQLPVDTAVATAAGFTSATGTEPPLPYGYRPRYGLATRTSGGVITNIAVPYPTAAALAGIYPGSITIGGNVYSFFEVFGESFGMPWFAWQGIPGPPGQAGPQGPPGPGAGGAVVEVSGSTYTVPGGTNALLIVSSVTDTTLIIPAATTNEGQSLAIFNNSTGTVSLIGADSADNIPWLQGFRLLQYDCLQMTAVSNLGGQGSGWLSTSLVPNQLARLSGGGQWTGDLFLDTGKITLSANSSGTGSLSGGIATITAANCTPASLVLAQNTTAARPLSVVPGNGSFDVTGTGSDSFSWVQFN